MHDYLPTMYLYGIIQWIAVVTGEERYDAGEAEAAGAAV